MTTQADSILTQLDRGLQARLTLILTRDGASPVLDHWLTRQSDPWARRTLTPVDNVPSQFLAHLTRASRRLLPSLSMIPLSEESDLLDGTVRLLNALLAVQRDFVLALASYHTIKSPVVRDATRLMVDYPPPHMHLYLVSTSPPQLGLARLRARRQLVEIDLRPTDRRGD